MDTGCFRALVHFLLTQVALVTVQALAPEVARVGKGQAEGGVLGAGRVLAEVNLLLADRSCKAAGTGAGIGGDLVNTLPAMQARDVLALVYLSLTPPTFKAWGGEL